MSTFQGEGHSHLKVEKFINFTFKRYSNEKSHFIEEQILTILHSQGKGKKVEDICLENNISLATSYQWKEKYSRMNARH